MKAKRENKLLPSTQEISRTLASETELLSLIAKYVNLGEVVQSLPERTSHTIMVGA